MNKLLILIVVVTLFSFGINSAFGESYTININQGASNPNCSNCYDVYNFEINQGDKVTWYNQDTATHTITGGTPQDGPSGTFDSGMISPGSSFTLTFTYDENYPFFCMLHPWLIGSANAQEASKNTTRITLNVSPDVVREGSSVTISGKLTSNGKGVSGGTVYLKDYDPLDISYDSIGTVVTDSNGNFKVTWKVRDLDSGDRKFSALILDALGGFGTVSTANSFLI